MWRDRPYLLLCGVQILLVLLSSSYVIILPLMILHVFHGPTWLVGASIVAGNVVLAGVQRPVVRYSRTRPRRTAILAALPVYAVSFGLLTALDHHRGTGVLVGGVLLAAALGGLAEAISTPLMISAAASAAPAGSQGRYSAAFQTSWGLARPSRRCCSPGSSSAATPPCGSLSPRSPRSPRPSSSEPADDSHRRCSPPPATGARPVERQRAHPVGKPAALR